MAITNWESTPWLRCPLVVTCKGPLSLRQPSLGGLGGWRIEDEGGAGMYKDPTLSILLCGINGREERRFRHSMASLCACLLLLSVDELSDSLLLETILYL